MMHSFKGLKLTSQLPKPVKRCWLSAHIEAWWWARGAKGRYASQGAAIADYLNYKLSQYLRAAPPPENRPRLISIGGDGSIIVRDNQDFNDLSRVLSDPTASNPRDWQGFLVRCISDLRNAVGEQFMKELGIATNELSRAEFAKEEAEDTLREYQAEFVRKLREGELKPQDTVKRLPRRLRSRDPLPSLWPALLAILGMIGTVIVEAWLLFIPLADFLGLDWTSWQAAWSQNAPQAITVFSMAIGVTGAAVYFMHWIMSLVAKIRIEMPLTEKIWRLLGVATLAGMLLAAVLCFAALRQGALRNLSASEEAYAEQLGKSEIPISSLVVVNLMVLFLGAELGRFAGARLRERTDKEMRLRTAIWNETEPDVREHERYQALSSFERHRIEQWGNMLEAAQEKIRSLSEQSVGFEAKLRQEIDRAVRSYWAFVDSVIAALELDRQCIMRAIGMQLKRSSTNDVLSGESLGARPATLVPEAFILVVRREEK